MKNRIRLAHLVALLAILGTLLPGGVQSHAIAAPPEQEPLPGIEIEPQLQSQLMSDDASGYLIYFREYPDLSQAYDMNWEERGRFVVNALQQTAARTQKNVRTYLDVQGTGYTAYWIDNVIVVDSSSMITFNGLMSFSEIAALRARRNPILYEPVESAVSTYSPDAIESNITHVGADQVWALGYTGEGIIVANIDTGVRYTHQALVNQYRGNQGGTSFDHNYNWWDPALGGSDLFPNDYNNHGSHTMGTILGDDGAGNQIGMAPGAKWIACQAFESGDAELLECGQFMAAPWDLNQENADSNLRPHVVNNSWGDCLQYADHWYDGVITSWHALGIYPVFSNGNASSCGYSSPPGLNTVGNPARAGNLTGVGSTGRDNGQYATHSNWGPTDDPDTVNPRGYPDLKPQILAPGVSIRSAYKGSDTDYGTMSGTSMSSPHVAGLVALMWSAAPCLVGDYAATETIIEETATPIPYDDGTGSGAHVPNYATGWGEINALAAVQAAQDACGDFTLGVTPDSQTICAPAEAIYNVDVTPFNGYNRPVVLIAHGEPAGTTVGFLPTPVTPLPGSTVLTIGDTDAAAVGSYSIDIVGASRNSIVTSTVELNIFDSIPGSVTLVTPLDGRTNVSITPDFEWSVATQVSTYTLEIATDSGFSNVVNSAVVDSTSYTLGIDLNTSTVYYWRVKASNPCGAGAYSPTWSFTTEAAPGDCDPGTVPSVLYSDDFETGAPGWTHNGTGDTWALSSANVHSGIYAYHGVDMPSVTDQRLISPSGGVVLPAGQSPLTLQFWNYQSLEDSTSGCYDGGVLEISTDGGGTWTQLPTGNMLTDPYDGPVSTSYSNPLGGQDAWCGEPQDWLKSIVDLDAYAGQMVQFRFRLGTDISTGHAGWDVDDVLLQSCVLAVPNFTFGPDSSIDTAPKSAVTHAFTLSNLGMADTYTLTLTGGGWPAALLTATQLAIGAGGSAQVEVQVDVPGLEGSDTFTVTAQSWGEPVAVLTATGSTQASIVPGLGLTPPSQAHTGSPGYVVTHTYTLTNTGNYTDTYDLALSGSSWVTGLGGSAAVKLSAGASAQVDVEVSIPPQVASVIIASDVFTLTATSQNDRSETAQAIGTSNANVNPNVEMSPVSQTQSGRPGEVVTHTYTITNTGDYTDTFGLTVTGAWTAALSADTSGALPTSGSMTVTLTVDIPPDAGDGELGIVMLTAASGLDVGVTSTATAITAAEWYKFYLTLILH